MRSIYAGCMGMDRVWRLGGITPIACLVFLLAWPTASVVAEEEAEGEADSGITYVPISPSLILNFQARGNIRHLRTDVVLSVRGDHSVTAVEENLPLIQNLLVLLLSAQDEITVSTPEGRFSMRSTTLAEVQQALQEERPDAEVVDVLFTNYFVE